MKRVDGDRVVETIDRDGLVAVQTPQAFRADALRAAHAGAETRPTTPRSSKRRVDAVVVVPGEPRNLKVTTLADLVSRARSSSPRHRSSGERDRGSARLRRAPVRRRAALVLGGVDRRWPGLVGHSDADAVAHAVADALLGAAGLPDLGTLFPATDERYRDASSIGLLRDVAGRVSAAGGGSGTSTSSSWPSARARAARRQHGGQPVPRPRPAVAGARRAEPRVGEAEAGRGPRRDRPRRGHRGLGGRRAARLSVDARSLDAGVRIYDTCRARRSTSSRRDPGRVSMYVCGPTLYDVPHLGHGRTAVVFDTIRRYLDGAGSTCRTSATSPTSRTRSSPAPPSEGTTEPELAQRVRGRVLGARWTASDVRRPDAMPHATEYIDAMLELIGELVDAGHAYVVEGQGVYFQVDSLPEYGALSHRTLERAARERPGARVEVDERKRSPVDFALWKAAKPGEPAWDSPWGKGRPGWHIECSAMSLEILGEGFDIHGGGNDLVFPHHENEIAQAEGAGHEFARHWIHNGMVKVDGEKMSKSLGNFTTLADVLDAHDPRAFRMVVLQTHYRQPDGARRRRARSRHAKAVDRLDALVRRARAGGIPPRRRSTRTPRRVQRRRWTTTSTRRPRWRSVFRPRP